MVSGASQAATPVLAGFFL
jgi:hypothetical protein